MHSWQRFLGEGRYVLVHEDDPEKFFRRSPWLVSAGDIARWRAAVEAERELEGY